MGGQGGGAQESTAQVTSLREELGSLRDPNSQEAQKIQSMIGGQVSPEQALAQRQSLAAINQGTQGAVQGARESAASRGLFSSDIGLGLEIGAQQQLAGQRAGIFQQRAQDVQGGILSGLQFSQQKAGLRGQLAGQISSLKTGVEQSNVASQNQFRQQQQQNSLAMAKMAGQVGGFFLGGPAGAAAGGEAVGAVGAGGAV
jgi:hypothetical protein